MIEMEKARTPELIGAEIRMYVDTGRRITLLCGIEIGRRLKEAKEMLPHGEWLPWLERETEFSTSSASRYIQAFEQYGTAQLGLFGPETNFPALGNLSITKALALIAVPEEERERFAEEHDVQNMSTRELEQAIREKKAAEERAEAAEKRAAEAKRELEKAEDGHELALAELEEKLETAQEGLRDALQKAAQAAEGVGPYKTRAEEAEQAAAKLREQLKELENRPIATVKERDEQAIEDAVRTAKAKAEAEAAEKINAIQKKLDKAERERDKLKDSAGKAESSAAEKVAAAEAEAEKLRRELEAARKAAKLSDANVTAFSIHFKAFQETAQALFAALGKIADADLTTAAKLAGGVEQLFSRYKTQTGEIKERAGGKGASARTDRNGGVMLEKA